MWLKWKETEAKAFGKSLSRDFCVDGLSKKRCLRYSKNILINRDVFAPISLNPCYNMMRSYIYDTGICRLQEIMEITD